VKLCSARLLSRLGCVSSLLLCGTQITQASVPAVVADGQVTLASGFAYPQGVAVASNGTIYVADMGNNRVVTVSSTGVVTPVGTGEFTLNGPTAVAVDAAGDLYIADAYNARVIEVPATGSPVQVAGPPTLSLPVALAVDASNNLYIGDGNNFAIYELPSSGSLVQLAVGNVSNLFPQALATDASGNLYIADADSSNIYKLPPHQTTAQNVTPTGFTLSSPAGLGFDAAGNLYVLDSGNTRVIEAPIAAGASPYEVPVTGLAAPGNLALDGEGNVYVTDVVNNTLTQLIYAGNAINLGQIAVGSTGLAVAVNYELNAPETLTAFKVSMQGDPAQEASIGAGTTCQLQSYTDAPPNGGNAISPTNPFVCLANVQGAPAFAGTRDGAVNLLGPSNSVLLSLPFTETGIAPVAWVAPGVVTAPVTGLTTPQGIAISGENNTVYIADAGAGKVYSWSGLNGSGSTLTPVATPGITLSMPTAVALDSAGDLFIADAGLDKIVVVPANTAVAPYTLATAGLLDYPIALAFDSSGNLYIGDGGPDGVNATASNPGFVLKIPPAGGPVSKINTSPANVVFPQVLATDSAGDLYIADGGDSSGSGIGQVVLVPANGNAPSALGISGLIDPAGLAVDPNGDLWVLDAENLGAITVVPSGGGSLYSVPLAAPVLGNPSQMLFAAGNDALLIPDIQNKQLVLVSGAHSQLTFPVTAVGSDSAAQTATIVSIGNSALKPTTTGGVSFAQTGNLGNFLISTAGIYPTFTELAPGQTGTLTATFAPAVGGTSMESLTSLFNSANQVQVLLSGATTNASSVTASPTFDPGTGTYESPLSVTLRDTTPGSVIYYTTNGSTPTTSSLTYSGPITVTATTTIQAFAVASGYSASPVSSAVYTITAGTQGGPVSDEFNESSLNTALWTVSAPAGGTVSVSNGHALLNVPGGSNHDPDDGGNNSVRIMQSISNVDFNVAAKFDSQLNANTQGQGILVQQDANTYLRIDIFSYEGTLYLEADAISGGNETSYIFNTISFTGTSMWLEVSRSGNTFTVSTSSDGTTYTSAGNFTVSLTVSAIGPFAWNYNSTPANAPALTSSVDWFRNLNGAPPAVTATPTFSPGSQTFTSPVSVSITDSTPDAVIYYTTDGSTPTTESSQYSGPITVTTFTTINAIAVAPGYSESSTGSATYTYTSGVTGAPVSDDFNESSLNTTLWTVSAPAGGTASVSNGHALLNVPGGSNHDPVAGGDNSVRIMQSISNVNFNVAAKFDSQLYGNTQGQGILVQQDANTYLRIDIFSYGSQLYVEAAGVSGGTETGYIINTISITGLSMWLQVSRSGNTFTVSTSSDGVNYTSAGNFSLSLSVSSIGPFAWNYNATPADAPALACSVDWFHDF